MSSSIPQIYFQLPKKAKLVFGLSLLTTGYLGLQYGDEFLHIDNWRKSKLFDILSHILPFSGNNPSKAISVEDQSHTQFQSLQSSTTASRTFVVSESSQEDIPCDCTSTWNCLNLKKRSLENGNTPVDCSQLQNSLYSCLVKHGKIDPNEPRPEWSQS